MRDIETIRSTRRPHVGWWLLLLWLALFAIALAGDRPIASQIHAAGIDAAIRGKWFAELIKFFGTFWFTLVLAAAGFTLWKWPVRDALFIILAGVVSGLNGLVKWLVGRTRPFKLPGPDQPHPFQFDPFWHGLRGLFHEKDLSFPSGHACTAFALAMVVILIRPKRAWFFLALACMVGAERILENAHYLSDVVAAVGFGAGGTLILHRMMRYASRFAR